MLVVVIDGEVPSTRLGAEVDVVDQSNARKFVERAVPCRGVDRPGGPFDGSGQDLLHSQEPFPVTGEHRADCASRQGEPEPGPSDPFVKESLDARRVAVGLHRGKGSR